MCVRVFSFFLCPTIVFLRSEQASGFLCNLSSTVSTMLLCKPLLRMKRRSLLCRNFIFKYVQLLCRLRIQHFIPMYVTDDLFEGYPCLYGFTRGLSSNVLVTFPSTSFAPLRHGVEGIPAHVLRTAVTAFISDSSPSYLRKTKLATHGKKLRILPNVGSGPRRGRNSASSRKGYVVNGHMTQKRNNSASPFPFCLRPAQSRDDQSTNHPIMNLNRSKTSRRC